MAQSKTILITEDDVFNCEILKEILVSRGYHVLTASNLAEMFERMNGSDRPDLLVLDLHLPDGTGLSAVETLRNQENHTPIVLITAAATSDNEKLAGEMGIRKVIIKPFTPAQILDEVGKILADPRQTQ